MKPLSMSRTGLLGCLLVASCGGQTSSLGDVGGPSTQGNAGQSAAGGSTGATAGGSTGAAAGGSTGASGSTGAAATADKLDLLFMIDNSSSMSDKQKVLAAVVPQMLTRFISPNCVDANGATAASAGLAQPTDGTAACPAGYHRQFAPVNDIHIAVVDSSLGGLGGQLCNYDATMDLNSNNNPEENDAAHLINRDTSNGTVAGVGQGPVAAPTHVPDAQPGGFLAWDPTGTANSPPGISDPAQLIGDFTRLVIGTDQIGCGVEQQMESWYRFLIDPNPWLTVNSPLGVGNANSVSGIDTVLLQQRSAFLRPDSLVAIILISDEDDVSLLNAPLPLQVADSNGNVGAWPASYGYDANKSFPANYLINDTALGGAPFYMPLATTACTDPNFGPYDPACNSCFFCALPAGSAPDYCVTDANCSTVPVGGSFALYAATNDAINLREVQMKWRFGIDFQMPLQRYVDGLTKPYVYDLNSDPNVAHAMPNPLFDDLPYNAMVAAGITPTRAKMPPRDPSLIVFAPIVGVPWQDLAVNGTPGEAASYNLDAGFRKVASSDPTDAVIDFEWILGDPFNHDNTARHNAQDPAMIETWHSRVDPTVNGALEYPITPAPIPATSDKAVLGAHQLITGETLGGPGTWNSINGHEYNPYNVAVKGPADLQYACIFDLPTPKDCSVAQDSCDCIDGYETGPDGTTPIVQYDRSPLCEAPATATVTDPGDGTTWNTTQYRAKAYPGLRYLAVARQLGADAVVGSICAKQTSDPSREDYGYNPTINGIVDQLKGKLTP